MKIEVLALALVGVVALSLPCAAQEEGATAADQQMQAMMAAMDKYGTPGPERQQLMQRVGTWDVQSSMWTDPAAEPSVSKGTAEQRAILGGRYLRSDYDGEMMDMPLSGFAVTGYDRYNRKYQSLWLDSTSTGFYLTEGTCDAAGRVCIETGVWDDYVTGKKTNVKNVTTSYGNDKYTMEMYNVLPGGKEVKVMELVYTRRVQE